MLNYGNDKLSSTCINPCGHACPFARGGRRVWGNCYVLQLLSASQSDYRSHIYQPHFKKLSHD